MSGREKNEAQQLFAELTDYERKGVELSLDGLPASPMQVVQAHILREDAVYMRDYVMDEMGDIRKLCFHDIKENKRL